MERYRKNKRSGVRWVYQRPVWSNCVCGKTPCVCGRAVPETRDGRAGHANALFLPGSEIF